MQLTSIIALEVSVLACFVRTATIEDVAASNLALAQQCIDMDEPVVAIRADTPPSTAQEVPTALQSFTNAIASAHAAVTQTAPASDNVTEFLLARSWGAFANEVEELMADYAEQIPYLVRVFGMRDVILEECLAFNKTFQDYGAFTLALVEPGDVYWWEIFYNIANATGNATSNPQRSGIALTISDYNATKAMSDIGARYL